MPGPVRSKLRNSVNYGASGASPTGRCSDGRADGQSDAVLAVAPCINQNEKTGLINFVILIKDFEFYACISVQREYTSSLSVFLLLYHFVSIFLSFLFLQFELTRTLGLLRKLK